MDKRLLKRHKRQVSRAKKRASLTPPDMRTPEQRAAAREASRAVTSRRNDPRTNYWTQSPKRARPAATDVMKADVSS